MKPEMRLPYSPFLQSPDVMTPDESPAPDRVSAAGLPENTSAELPTSAPPRTSLPELPPVAPPSAGFIVQLFLVPAAIVGVVIGIWVLFGRIASDEQDVTRVVAELRSGNSHRRWRAAFNLAQILEADAHRTVDGRQLVEDPEIAQALATLLQESLQQDSNDVEDLQQAAYLARALGWFHLPEVVLPPLEATIAKGDADLPLEGEKDVVAELKQARRVSALTSVAQVAGRAIDSKQPVTSPEVIATVIEASTSQSKLIRQLSAYCLGLLPAEVARQRLELMLIDPDMDTRVNAAIALVRQDSAVGLDVFLRVLSENLPREAEADDRTHEDALERFIVAKNSLKAVEQLVPRLTPAQQREVHQAVTPWSEQAEHPEVRLAADAVLRALPMP